MNEREQVASQGTAPIVVKDLRKSFGEQRVLCGLDLNVSEGETLAILGRSGTGKSVFLRLLVGLERPDSGSIQVEGEEIASLGTAELNQVRKKIGFLFQHGALYDSLTVGENVAFPLNRHLQLPGDEVAQRARELLSAVGMEKDMNKLPSQISGGMRKRAALARALAIDPQILLFDEPTSGLDPITAVEIGELIVNLKKQRSITSIVVTHDVHGARLYADRLILIHEGAVLVEGTFDDLQKSTNEFAARFLRGVM
jgi:phospholipid/cholesterol/gamma-HCH transport system ATP-binding protein